MLLELKPLSTELLPAVLELDRQCFGGLWTESGYRRELASSSSELLTLICPSNLDSAHSVEPEQAGAELLGLGCLWSILSEAHITILAVHPHYRHQGFGQTILHGLLSAAHQRSLEQATLEVRASNQPALSLYQKFGFQEVGRRRRYYRDTDEDGLVLWRSGLQQPAFEHALSQWRQHTDTRLAQSGWSLARYPKAYTYA